jgi:hypothetical protein
MSPTSEPFSCDTSLLHLDDDGTMAFHPKPSRMEHPLAAPWSDRGHLVSVCSYDRTWPYCERHPSGDELAVVLDGHVELELVDGEAEHVVPVAAGQACVIPRGSWHRALMHAPSTMLFVTPTPALTEHQPDR